jgi:thymidine kinase
VLIVKAGIDNRYDISHVVTHAGAKMRAVNASCSDDVARFADGYGVVGVDELHFFDDAIADVCAALAERGQRVIVAGLDTDFRAEPFVAMPDLLARAEFVDKLQAVCHRCGGPATRTQRLVNGEPAPFSGDTIQVGALDAYEARCRGCYEPGRDVIGVAARTGVRSHSLT